MNTLIIGIGNLGFETAKKINSKNDKIFLVSRSLPEYARGMINNRTIFHLQGDATSYSSMSNILKLIIDNHGITSIDSLIITPGLATEDTFINNIDNFISCFEFNYFAYINPLKVFTKLLKPKGGIILISATSAHHADKRLTAYPASKWALENVFSSLREELKSRQISVDVIAVKTIKNKYSKVWLQEKGVNPENVARLIYKITKAPKNKRHYFPSYYSMFRITERTFPSLLDWHHGLKGKKSRQNKHSKIQCNKVLITGAASGLGKALSEAYAMTAKEIILCDINELGLKELKNSLESNINCKVHTIVLDVTNRAQTKIELQKIESVDLLINNVGVRFQGAIEETPNDQYNLNLNINLYSHLFFISYFFNNGIPPKKIINILSTTAIRGRRFHALYSSAKAALWNCTRSLKRVYGTQIQVLEVIPSWMANTKLMENSITIEKENKIINTNSQPNKTVYFQHFAKKILRVGNITSQNAAFLIKKAEEKGSEVLFIPSIRAKMFMFCELYFPRLFNLIFKI